jgi:predicted RNA methylase
MRATYSPEDNKLRLYNDKRLDDEDYKVIADVGFRWAPKQKIFVAPMWTPQREDALLTLVDGIEDEDTTLTERAVERSDRFEDYSEHRQRDAEAAAKGVDRFLDGIPFGQPILVGHHSEKRARKDAEKIESGLRKAVKMWETSAYWTERASGALRHAKYKELPAVRARRIKGLEKEEREFTKNIAEAEICIRLWETALTLSEEGALKAAIHVANFNRQTPHGTWSDLNDGRLTPNEAASKAIESNQKTIAWANRYLDHTVNRLVYERALLAASPSTVAAIVTGVVKPEKGGAVYLGRHWAQRGQEEWLIIERVNKVSVTVSEKAAYGGGVYSRLITFDEIKKLKTKTEVAEALLDEATTQTNGYSFTVRKESKPEATMQPEPISTLPTTSDPADAIKAALIAGISIASGNELFPTPNEIVTQMLDLADVSNEHTVLEPSAGTGRIMRRLPGKVVAVELNLELAAALEPDASQIVCSDFLSWKPDDGAEFDRVVMNPPFSSNQDVHHVRHAYGLLKPGGILVSIMSRHWTFANDKPSVAFREFYEDHGDSFTELPADAFKLSGTRVATVMIRLVKPLE